jgi:hypothetical protein
MATVLVPFQMRELVPKEPIQRELCWYDPLREEMRIFFGGQLKFEYREDDYLVAMSPDERRRRGIKSTYRLLPKVEELQVRNYNNTVRTSNRHRVFSWFRDYINYNNTDATISDQTHYGVEFSVPDDEVSDFVYDLERNGLSFEVM